MQQRSRYLFFKTPLDIRLRKQGFKEKISSRFFFCLNLQGVIAHTVWGMQRGWQRDTANTSGTRGSKTLQLADRATHLLSVHCAQNPRLGDQVWFESTFVNVFSINTFTEQNLCTYCLDIFPVAQELLKISVMMTAHSSLSCQILNGRHISEFILLVTHVGFVNFPKDIKREMN